MSKTYVSNATATCEHYAHMRVCSLMSRKQYIGSGPRHADDSDVTPSLETLRMRYMRPPVLPSLSCFGIALVNGLITVVAYRPTPTIPFNLSFGGLFGLIGAAIALSCILRHRRNGLGRRVLFILWACVAANILAVLGLCLIAEFV